MNSFHSTQNPHQRQVSSPHAHHSLTSTSHSHHLVSANLGSTNHRCTDSLDDILARELEQIRNMFVPP